MLENSMSENPMLENSRKRSNPVCEGRSELVEEVASRLGFGKWHSVNRKRNLGYRIS